MVVSSWMRRSLALLLGSTSRSGRREVIDLLHARGVHLSRWVGTLVATLVGEGAAPHTGAALADGDEVTPLPLLGEVVQSNAKSRRFTENPPPPRTLNAFPPSAFYTLQNHRCASSPLASVALTLLAPTFMTSPYLSVVASFIALPVVLHVLFCIPFDILSVPR